MSDQQRTATIDWDDPDMLRARANLIGWERNVAQRYAEVGNTVAALDALRQVRQRFPGFRIIDNAVVEFEYGPLVAAHSALSQAKDGLAKAKVEWARYEAHNGSLEAGE